MINLLIFMIIAHGTNCISPRANMHAHKQVVSQQTLRRAVVNQVPAVLYYVKFDRGIYIIRFSNYFAWLYGSFLLRLNHMKAKFYVN